MMIIIKISRHGTNIDDINNTLLQVHNWFTVNTLVLNGNKTKCIRFALPNVKSNDCDVLNQEKLEFFTKTVFWGSPSTQGYNGVLI